MRGNRHAGYRKSEKNNLNDRVSIYVIGEFCEKMKNRMLLGGIIGAVIMLVIVGAVWGITSARRQECV